MAVTGTFAATGQSAAFTPRVGGRALPSTFNLELRGTFVATVALERSLDGTNWVALTALGTPISFAGVCSEILEEPEIGAQYRLNCTAYTSGTVTYRLSN